MYSRSCLCADRYTFHFDIDEASSIYSDVSTASSPMLCCGENVGCGTTTDESDEERKIPVAKKAKVDVACKRRSKRLKAMQSDNSSHSSQKVMQTKQLQSGSQAKQSGSGKRGGQKQGKKDQAKSVRTKGKEQKDSVTGYL